MITVKYDVYFEGDTSIEKQSSLAKEEHKLPEESKGDVGRWISVLGRRNTYMFIDPETKESLAHSRNEKYSVWNGGIARDKPGGLGRS